VRYALETRFLVVRADTLEPEVEAALSGLPRTWRSKFPPGSLPPAVRPLGKKNGMAAWSLPVVSTH